MISVKCLEYSLLQLLEFFMILLLDLNLIFANEFVKMPTGERLNKVKRMYEQLGLPGCKGSMDCNHISWDKCSYTLKNMCTGKEKEPTLSFNCIVDHSRLIYHCSLAFSGASNDRILQVMI